MTDRPQILPGVLASISSSAPARLQKKLDKQPDVANDWDWQHTDNQWQVAAGNEQVLLTANPIVSVDDVACSCLLGPRCFHVLAALSTLQISDAPELEDDSEEQSVVPDDSVMADKAALTDVQIAAAADMFVQCSSILAAGMRAAGTVLQSRLLRAIHECRSEGLHRLASGGLRLMQNIRSLRSGEDTFDSAAAESDLLEAMEVAWRLTRPDAVATSAVVGVARRRYTPVNSLKLHGLCSEPLLTRSGYSGVVTYLMGEDGWICSVSDVQPGDATRILQAWKSGVSVAGLSLSHRDLSRQCLLVSKATKSVDGRLGGAESAQAVTVQGLGWDAAPIAAAFDRPLDQQIEYCFERERLPVAERPAGADLVFVKGTIAGCCETELLLAQSDGRVLRLAITIDDDAIPFRDNLTLLARAPGLRLRCVTRLNFLRPGHLNLLAIAADDTDADADTDPETDVAPDDADQAANENTPQLILNEGTPFHVAVGLDQLSRGQLTTAERQPVEIALPDDSGNITDESLSRWLRAIALGGRHAVPSGVVTSAVRDAVALQRQLRPTAAGLLYSLTQSAISTETDILGVRFPKDSSALGQYWLATATASRATSQHLQQLRWLAQVLPSG